jgi:hypothetical protein
MDIKELTGSIGVLWSGDHLFEGTKETIEMLRSKRDFTHATRNQEQ